MASRENLTKKASLTTTLGSLAQQHVESQRVCLELAEEARRIKLKDQELSRLLNESM